MAEFRSYRTYRYITKNPVIDRVRTILQDEHLYGKELGKVHEISGVARATLDGWFYGDTRNPQHGTVMAVLSSLGYEEQFVKAKDIDVEAERTVGKKWLRARIEAKRRARKEAPAKGNGHRKPRAKVKP